MKKVLIDEYNYLRVHEDALFDEPENDEYIESPAEAQSNYEMFLKLEKERQEENDK